MSDRWVQIYVYVLIGSSVFSTLLWAVLWLAQSRRPRHPLMKAKYHWRHLFFLITGLICWYLFLTHALNNSLIMIISFVMLLAAFYFAELLGRSLKRGGNNHAT
jgi:cobalamin synthase